MNIFLQFFRSIFTIIITILQIPYNFIMNSQIRTIYFTNFLIMGITYVVIMLCYCYLFHIRYIKFIQATIFPIIGMIMLIIQGIIYIFFIPYNIVNVIKDTFAHTFQVLSVIIDWLYNFINITLNIEDYLLNV